VLQRNLLNLYATQKPFNLEQINKIEQTIKIKYRTEIYPLKYEHIVFSVIVQLKCQNCGEYLSKYKCPPYVPKYWQTRELLKRFNFFRLIIATESSKPWYERNKPYGTNEYLKLYRAGETANIIAVSRLHHSILYYKSSLDLHNIRNIAYSHGGGCRACGPRPCGVLSNEPCRHPDKAMPSPEAVGIDLYTTVRALGINLEVPPKWNYSSAGLICALIPNYQENSIIKTRRVTENFPDKQFLEELFQTLDYENPLDIYESQDCRNCKQYSDFLCDKSLYKEEDLKEWLKNKRLYTVKLQNKTKTIAGVNELYQNYTLKLLRKGYWWTFAFASHRCPACVDCNKKNHLNGGYKIVQNRRIIRCIKSFNLHPKTVGDNIAYLLV